MALNSLFCADVPLSNYSLTHWAAFSHQAALELCTDTICSAEDPIQQFTDVINIAINNIPKSKQNTKKHNTIWCNEDFKAAIKTPECLIRRWEYLKEVSSQSHSLL